MKKKKNSKEFKKRFKKRFLTKKAVVTLLLAAVIVAALALGYRDTQKRAAKYQETIEELHTEIKDIKKTNETLEEEKDNIDSDASRERIARERLGMIEKDEKSLRESDSTEP